MQFQTTTRQWDGRIQFAGEAASNQFGTFTVEGPSAKQAGFLQSLLRKREVPAVIRERFPAGPAEMRNLSKDSTSALIDLMLQQPEVTPAAAPMPARTNSSRRPNQFAGKCVKCGGRVEAEAGFLAKDADGKWAAEHNGTCPAPQAVRADVPAEGLTPGVYKVDGTVYVVKPNREKTRLYAKRLVELTAAQGDRLNADDEHVRVEFEYAPGAIFQITPVHRMSVEEGKALTIRYGKCICCSRTLKVAESVERGIGPVCIKYFAA